MLESVYAYLEKKPNLGTRTESDEDGRKSAGGASTSFTDTRKMRNYEGWHF